MRSSRRIRTRLSDQGGFGLVDSLVAITLIGIAAVVLIGSLGSLLVGARVAERKSVESRLARNQMEFLMGQPFPAGCPANPAGQTVDGVPYTIDVKCTFATSGQLVTYSVDVWPNGSANSDISLTANRASLP